MSYESDRLASFTLQSSFTQGTRCLSFSFCFLSISPRLPPPPHTPNQPPPFRSQRRRTEFPASAAPPAFRRFSPSPPRFPSKEGRHPKPFFSLFFPLPLEILACCLKDPTTLLYDFSTKVLSTESVPFFFFGKVPPTPLVPSR